ncbi:MAG: acyl-CoA dehydrogenase family protein [Planctomycetes bacterium]|nr:acyl-CoA dehydrogenase family protein [Planctomycetota bacterium]
MPSKYRELDFFDVSELLNDEERMVRETVRNFVDAEVLPIVGDHYERGEFPEGLMGKMAELGLFGANLPEKYGCAGLGDSAYGIIMQELERGDSGIRSAASVQGALVMYPIFAYGSEEQRKHWLPKLAKGEAIGCFGLTEPDFGSNPGGMQTRARRTDRGWVIHGRKMWITNGTVSDVAVVWARVEDGSIRGFLVEKGTPGFSAPEQLHKFSLRCSITSELVLEEVEVPAEALLPGTTGLKHALGCLTQARYGISWGAVGAAQACFDEALGYSKERIIFDKPLAGFQLAQQKLADMATEITKAQFLCWRLGQLKQQKRMTHSQVSMAKRNNVQMALDCARSARDMLGANGIVLEYQSGRHLCNLETVNTYEGTYDIHTLAIGHELTGIPAYR